MGFRIMLAAAAAGALLLCRGAHADTITLAEALQRAEQRTDVAATGARLDAARAETDQARRPRYNPGLSAAIGPRRVGGSTGLEAEVSIDQVIELGGKRAARRAGAAAREKLAAAELEGGRRQARLEAWAAFHLALVARARLDAARDGERIAEEVATATATRLGLGGGTQLQVNLTAAELGRARHERLDAETGLAQELGALASAVGAGATEVLEPVGELPAFSDLPWTAEEVVARATRQRPELRASRAAEEAAVADVRIADADATPDLAVALSYGLEQEPDSSAHVVLLGASIGLPLRNRNQGGRAAARARLRGAALDRAYLTREVEREARLAHQSYARAVAAMRGYDQDVNLRLAENLGLARDSYTSGKIDYFEFNLARHELFAARVAYLDAVAEAIAARVAIVRAIGTEELP